MSASKQKNNLSSNPMGAASLAVLYNFWGEGDSGESEIPEQTSGSDELPSTPWHWETFDQ